MTPNTINELISHEAIVPEAYKDSKGVWTWSVGITNAAGIDVMKYKDNPQSLRICIDAFKKVLQDKYVNDVLKAFAGITLTETQFAAALSFHYNTGAILHCSWVHDFLCGNILKAKTEFMQWNKPAEIISRRQKECDLFFLGKWGNDGTATVYPVKKPSYTPDFKNGKHIRIGDSV